VWVHAAFMAVRRLGRHEMKLLSNDVDTTSAHPCRGSSGASGVTTPRLVSSNNLTQDLELSRWLQLNVINIAHRAGKNLGFGSSF